MANNEKEPNIGQNQVDPEFRGRQRINEGLYDFHLAGYTSTLAVALLLSGIAFIRAIGSYLEEDSTRALLNFGLSILNLKAGEITVTDFQQFKRRFYPSNSPDNL